jgi:hypothetical protein
MTGFLPRHALRSLDVAEAAEAVELAAALLMGWTTIWHMTGVLIWMLVSVGIRHRVIQCGWLLECDIGVKRIA